MINDRPNKFRVLFFVLVGLVSGYPVLKAAIETRILFDLITTAVFFVALATVFDRGTSRRHSATGSGEYGDGAAGSVSGRGGKGS